MVDFKAENLILVSPSRTRYKEFIGKITSHPTFWMVTWAMLNERETVF